MGGRAIEQLFLLVQRYTFIFHSYLFAWRHLQSIKQLNVRFSQQMACSFLFENLIHSATPNLSPPQKKNHIIEMEYLNKNNNHGQRKKLDIGYLLILHKIITNQKKNSIWILHKRIFKNS